MNKKKKYSIMKPFYKQPFLMILFILLIVYVVSFFVPFLWAFFASFNSALEYGNQSNYSKMDTVFDSLGRVFAFPKESFQIKNYLLALTNLRKMVHGRYIRIISLLTNSIIYSVGATFITTFSHAITAYIAARYSKNHWIARILYPIVIVAMVLPIVGSLPSEIRILNMLNLYDKVYGVWLMKCGFLGSNFLIFYATYRGISWEYAEAAFIDGATHSQVLFKIMIPLSATTLGALALMSFITYWNDWKVEVQYMPNFPMIANALYQFQIPGSVEKEADNTPTAMAACMLVAAPLIVVFLIFKDKLMNNLTVGGIKG